jgi:excisionase family DNA binding protein
MAEQIPQLLTLLELAERLRVSPHTVRSWVRKGKLRPVRLCRRLLFQPDEVARFLAEAK